MLYIILWGLFGAMSGWIGYLADASSHRAHMRPYVSVGVSGAIVGGFVSQLFGGSANYSGAIDTVSVFNAIFASAILVIIFVALRGLLEKTNPR